MTRLRRFLLPGIGAVLALAVIAWVVWPAKNREVNGPSKSIFSNSFGKREVEIALLAREQGPLTDLHTICLGQLFDEWNHQGKEERDYRFTLRTYDLKSLREKHGDIPPYEALAAENGNLAAVIDNTWGSDLQKSLTPVKERSIPVISLNADRTADFGDTVLFLGSQNMVSAKVASFMSQALMTAPDPAAVPIVVFLTEKGYGAKQPDPAGGYRYLYEDEIEKAQLRFDAKISFNEADFDNAGEQSRVAKEMREALAVGGNRNVVVVINAHKNWGSRLVAGLEAFAANDPDRSFRVIGHDTVFDQTIHDKVRLDTADKEKSMDFELILLKAPNPEYSTRTFGIYQSIFEGHPDLIQTPETARKMPGKYGEFPGFPKEVASIFIRRCAVATELLQYSYRDLEHRERLAATAAGEDWLRKSRVEQDRILLGGAFRALRSLASDPGRSGKMRGLAANAPGIAKAKQGTHLELGALGLVHFNASGEEDGSNYFELHKPGNKPMAHLKQLNADNKLIPALQIGINEFQIRRVDVERGEFDAEFICSTTISSSLKDKVLFEIKEIQEDERLREVVPEDESATGDPRGRLVQYPMLSGLLSIPNMRADGSVAQIGQTDRSVEDTEYRVYKVRGTFAADLNTARYPFDSHQIGVELQAGVPDHLLTLTAQRVASTAWEENQRGWIVKWIHGLVDNRVANGNPMAISDEHAQTHQFKEFAIMVGVLRDIRQPMLVVMLPLILLGAAAIGIMFLGEKEAMGKSPSELAMGLVLGIVAYSISYAEVVPRSGGGTHSDQLYLFTTLLCMGNFGAVLVFGELGNTKTRNDAVDRWRVRYGIIVASAFLLFLIIWYFGG